MTPAWSGAGRRSRRLFHDATTRPDFPIGRKARRRREIGSPASALVEAVITGAARNLLRSPSRPSHAFENLGHRLREVGLERTRGPAGDVRPVTEDIRRRAERYARRSGSVPRSLCLALRGGRSASRRPGAGRRFRTGRRGSVQPSAPNVKRLAAPKTQKARAERRNSRKIRRRLHAGAAERLFVVPDRRFVARLEDDPVELAAHRADPSATPARSQPRRSTRANVSGPGEAMSRGQARFIRKRARQDRDVRPLPGRPRFQQRVGECVPGRKSYVAVVPGSAVSNSSRSTARKRTSPSAPGPRAHDRDACRTAARDPSDFCSPPRQIGRARQ